MDSQNLIDLFSLKLDNASKRHFPPFPPSPVSSPLWSYKKQKNATSQIFKNKTNPWPPAGSSTNDGEDHSAVVNVEYFPSLVVNGGSM